MNTQTANCKSKSQVTFQDVVDDFFNLASTVDKSARTQFYDKSIKANVIEHRDKVTISAALPGIKKSDVNIELKEQTLTVAVKHNEVNQDAETPLNYKWREFDYATSRRTFKLSKAIDTTSINAEMSNGVLTISLDKKPAFVPTTIEIK